MNILHANAHSIFDYINGSSNSIRLLLQQFAKSGHNVYCVNGCISDSEYGYQKSSELWHQSSSLERNKSRFITRFKLNNINISLIRTRHWQRNLLSSDEEENIFRESLNIIYENNIDLIIGWGNLLLEESIFREAKIKGSKICLYLVNPSFKGKRNFIIKNADLAITDSSATKKLYKEEIKCKFEVIPKIISVNNLVEADDYSRKKNILFVNPSINKGLEPLIILSKYLSENNINMMINCIDGRQLFWREITYLGYKRENIPKNINIIPPKESIDVILRNSKILLLLSIWHESGSRLILESYAKGVPVLGFNTGGNSEFFFNSQQDLFNSPELFLDNNQVLRVKKWDPKDMFKRIIFLLQNDHYYNYYSKKLLNIFSQEKLNQKNNTVVQKILSSLN